MPDTIPSERLQKLRKNYAHLLSTFIIGPRSSHSPLPERMLELGKGIRENYTRYPILPGAVHTYLDLAATREWVVSGQPRPAARAVDWLNNAETINPYTGMVDYGFEQFERRRALDHLCVGATAFASNDYPEAALEYIDPTGLRFIHETRRVNGRVQKVQPDDRTWYYDNQRFFKNKELWLHYPIPVGSGGYLSPLMHLLPTASLAWLIRESDTATVDGRRIRDIIFIQSTLADTVEEAILTQLALWSGANPEEVGIPIIPIQGATMPIKDMFARLGISEIPPTFDREKFEFSFVNEIGGAIGLALRHFWNNERTTNRALEVVQEQRQQQKGPSSFIRSEQRLINRTGLLKRFGGSVKLPTRFSYIEETDSASLKDRAEVLKFMAEAFGVFFDRLQLSVKPESLVAWMQSLGQLPYELEFVQAGQAPKGEIIPSDETSSGNSERVQQSSDPAPSSLEQIEKSLGLSEVMINQDGQVILKRAQFFSLNMILEKELSEVKEQLQALEEMSEEEFLKQLEDDTDEKLRLQFLYKLEYDATSLDKWVEHESFEGLCYKISNAVHFLNQDERDLLTEIYLSE